MPSQDNPCITRQISGLTLPNALPLSSTSTKRSGRIPALFSRLSDQLPRPMSYMEVELAMDLSVAITPQSL